MHFGKSHLEDKREDLRSHYGKIEKTAGCASRSVFFLSFSSAVPGL